MPSSPADTPVPMNIFYEPVSAELDAVNRQIVSQLQSRVPLVENIGQYIVSAGGKRLRPLLVLLVARALGYSGPHHITLATIIEFIHTATLLHDDVVDLSQLRRNRPTANAEFGNAPSVLVGDFLYSRAFQMLVEVGDLRVMRLMSDATNVIAEGEVLQLANAGNPDTSEDSYFQVIDFKTARLFAVASQLAAVISDSTETVIDGCCRYGHHLGLSFQLVDDLLDYTGESSALGKNVGDDLAEGKPTLPLIYTLRHGSPQQRQLVSDAIRNKDGTRLDEVVQAVQQCGALEYTRQQALTQRALALAALADLPASPRLAPLEALAHFSVDRKY